MLLIGICKIKHGSKMFVPVNTVSGSKRATVGGNSVIMLYL